MFERKLDDSLSILLKIEGTKQEIIAFLGQIPNSFLEEIRTTLEMVRGKERYQVLENSFVLEDISTWSYEITREWDETTLKVSHKEGEKETSLQLVSQRPYSNLSFFWIGTFTCDRKEIEYYCFPTKQGYVVTTHQGNEVSQQTVIKKKGKQFSSRSKN